MVHSIRFLHKTTQKCLVFPCGARGRKQSQGCGSRCGVVHIRAFTSHHLHGIYSAALSAGPIYSKLQCIGHFSAENTVILASTWGKAFWPWWRGGQSSTWGKHVRRIRESQQCLGEAVWPCFASRQYLEKSTLAVSWGVGFRS